MATVFRVHTEINRSFDGVSVPAHQRLRSTVNRTYPSLIPEAEVLRRERERLRSIERILKIERWKEVRADG